MKLLKTTQPAELPTEALLARLRCRRAGIDLAAGQEHARAVPQTPSVGSTSVLTVACGTRLTPFLDLLAMRSLILSLRYTLAGETPPTAVLRHSLLAAPIQRTNRNGRVPRPLSPDSSRLLPETIPLSPG